MKRRRLFCFILMAFLLTISNYARAQNNVTASISQDGDVSFKVVKPAFYILLSQKGRMTGYVIHANGSFSYNANGRVEKVGAVNISYDFDSRINKIDTDQISYDFDGRVSQIGGTKVSYNINNNVDNIGGKQVTYNHNGKADKISSATISYDLNGKVDKINDDQGIVNFSFIPVN
jgi:hypothetical protein